MPKKKDEPTLKDVVGMIDDLTHMTAKWFESTASKQEIQNIKQESHEFKHDVQQFKQEVRTGFSVVMDALGPLQHDYDALKDDLAPRMSTVETRLTKVERKL